LENKAMLETSKPLRRLLRRSEAANYLLHTWAVTCAVGTLAKLAVIGGGPRFSKAGKWPVYAIEDLDEWARSKTSPTVGSTAELRVLQTEREVA
jgi:hypothetical protein